MSHHLSRNNRTTAKHQAPCQAELGHQSETFFNQAPAVQFWGPLPPPTPPTPTPLQAHFPTYPPHPPHFKPTSPPTPPTPPPLQAHLRELGGLRVQLGAQRLHRGLVRLLQPLLQLRLPGAQQLRRRHGLPHVLGAKTGGLGPRRPTGPTGPKGPKGPKGPQNNFSLAPKKKEKKKRSVSHQDMDRRFLGLLLGAKRSQNEKHKSLSHHQDPCPEKCLGMGQVRKKKFESPKGYGPRVFGFVGSMVMFCPWFHGQNKNESPPGPAHDVLRNLGMRQKSTTRSFSLLAPFLPRSILNAYV